MRKIESVLVIGLGRFGRHLALKFNDLGKDVMVIDISEESVEAVLQNIADAVIGDATKEAVLRSIGVDNFDLCIVAIGSNFGASLETTLMLKELGAKYVIAKATRDNHAKFLLRSGADETVYPEKYIAEKLAMRFSTDNIYDYIELNPEYSIVEVPIRKDWVNKTIEQLAFRQRYQVNILATKLNNVIVPLTRADHQLDADEHLIVFGNKEDLLKFSGRL